MKIFNINKIVSILFVLLGVLKLNAQVIDTTYIVNSIDSVYKGANDSAFALSTTINAINQSRELGYQDGEVSAMQLLGYLYIDYGNLDSAKKYLFESHELTKKITNQKIIAQNYRLLAIYYESIDNFEKALDLLFRSLIIRKRINDIKGEHATYISIGVIYQRLSSDPKAIYYYTKALKYFESIKSENVAASIYSNLGAIYNGIGKIDSAIIYLKKVIVFKTKIGDKISLAKAYSNIGTSYTYLGNYTKAINCINQSISLSGGGINNFNNGNDYSMLGGIYVKMGQLTEAEKYLLISERIYRQCNDITSLIALYSTLSDLYDSKKDFSKGIYYRSTSNKLKDSLDQIDEKSLISEIETKYKTQEKEQENELLKAQNKLLQSESRSNTLLAIALLFVLFISFYLAYNLNLVKKTKNKLIHKNQIIESKNREVANQNQDLSMLNKENQSLMGILAHDLRSPFSKILGLSNLLESEPNENERVVFINYINSICKESLHLIQETIDISELFNHNVTPLKIEKFAPSAILTNLTNSFVAIANEKEINLEFINTLQDIEITNSKEYFTRTLDNLISNAIKFSPLKSQVIVSAIKLNNNLVFSVKDNGPGFTEKDKEQLFTRFKKLSARPTANEASSGLGLFIVKQLTNLMKGDIKVISEHNKGSEFVLSIPIEFSKEI